MDMAQIYHTISTAAFIAAAVCLAFAIFCWFKFGIWKIIGDLSGRNAKKSIEQMRAENEKSGKKSFRPTPIAVNRGSLTEAIDQISKQQKSSDVSKIQSSESTKTDPYKTDKLSESMQTVPLVQDHGGTTEILDNGTEVLEGTALLGEVTEPLQRNVNIVELEMVQDIVLIHTDEEIE